MPCNPLKGEIDFFPPAIPCLTLTAHFFFLLPAGSHKPGSNKLGADWYHWCCVPGASQELLFVVSGVECLICLSGGLEPWHLQSNKKKAIVVEQFSDILLLMPCQRAQRKVLRRVTDTAKLFSLRVHMTVLSGALHHSALNFIILALKEFLALL